MNKLTHQEILERLNEIQKDKVLNDYIGDDKLNLKLREDSEVQVNNKLNECSIVSSRWMKYGRESNRDIIPTTISKVFSSSEDVNIAVCLLVINDYDELKRDY